MDSDVRQWTAKARASLRSLGSAIFRDRRVARLRALRFLARRMGVAPRPTASRSRRAFSQAPRLRPLHAINSSTVSKCSGSTLPSYAELRIDGQMYDDLHTAGVFPRWDAVSFTAALSILRVSVTPGTRSLCRRARMLAQIIVPAQVRKSLAEKRSPIVSLMYSLMWCRW